MRDTASPPKALAMTWLGIVALSTTVALAAMSMWTDVKTRQIPHWIVGGIVVCWIVAAVFEPKALGGAPLLGLLCGGVVLAMGFVLHALGWLGGGDGKLLAAVALWLGPGGCGLGADRPRARWGLLLTLWAVVRLVEWQQRGIPYAIAIAPPASAMLAMRAMA